MRAMNFDHPEMGFIRDQYMLGEDILVAPVVAGRADAHRGLPLGASGRATTAPSSRALLRGRQGPHHPTALVPKIG